MFQLAPLAVLSGVRSAGAIASAPIPPVSPASKELSEATILRIDNRPLNALIAGGAWPPKTFDHIRSSWLTTSPADPLLRPFIQLRPQLVYKVCSMNISHRTPKEEAIEGVIETIVDNLPFYPRLVLTDIPMNREALEMISGRLRNRFLHIKLPKSFQVVVMALDHYLYLWNEKESIFSPIVSLQVTESLDRRCDWMIEFDALVKDVQLGRIQVPALPTKQMIFERLNVGPELENADPLRQLKVLNLLPSLQRKLLLSYLAPDLLESFPRALAQTQLPIRAAELYRVFSVDLTGKTKPATPAGRRAMAQELGISPDLFWLRFNPLPFFFFEFVDSREHFGITPKRKLLPKIEGEKCKGEPDADTLKRLLASNVKRNAWKEYDLHL
jgi:hypothetical protein